MKHYREFAKLAIIFLMLTGCVKQEIPEEQSTTATPVMWKTEGFAVNDELIEEQELWVARHIKWEHDDVMIEEEREKIFLTPLEVGVVGDKIYRFSTIVESPNAIPVRGVMECFDTTSMEKSIIELSAQQMGKLYDSSEVIVDVDINNCNNYVFQWVGYGYNDSGDYVQTSNRMFFLNENGEKQEKNLLPVYLEKGISYKKYDSFDISGECVCDTSGNSYVKGKYSNSFFVIDINGETLIEYKGSIDEEIYAPIKTVDSEIIYPCYNKAGKTTKLLWVDIVNGNVKTLANVKDSIRQLYGLRGNNLYYENFSGIVKWDIATGERKLILNFKENGIRDVYNTQLVFKANDTPVLRMFGYVNNQFEDWILIMSEQSVVKDNPVRIVNLTDTSDRVRTCTSVTARHNPDYSYVYEEGKGKDTSDFYSIIMAEMTSGTGPDILYVSAEIMEMLEQKGLLADLREYIPQDTLDKVIPGVIELGTVNGTFKGMATDIMAAYAMIQDDVWSGENWTLDDMISLIESGRISGRIRSGDYLSSSKAAMGFMLEYLLVDSFVIDWDNNESHFDDERFVKLVDYIGNYQSEKCDGDYSLFDGAIISDAISYFSSVNEFRGTKGNRGWHYIGFPTDHGCGNYIDAYGYVVVNAKTKSKEAVTAYLECLLDNEIQDIHTWGSGLPVIQLQTEKIVLYEDGTARFNGWDLLVFADGSTAIDELNELLAMCVPVPRKYAVIENIVWEELQEYYSGNKSAVEVAGIIDGRVQIYLDEME